MKAEQVKRGRGRQPDAIPMDTLWRKPDAMPAWAQPKTLSEALDAVREMRATGGREAALVLWEAMGLPPMVAPQPPSSLPGADVVRRFLRERVVKAPGHRLSAAALWDGLKAWAVQSGVGCPSRTRLGLEARRAGFKPVELTGRMVYDGIRLSVPRNPAGVRKASGQETLKRR